MNFHSGKAETTAPSVGSLVKALAILRHLAAHPQPAGVNAIARAVGVSPSSCFNILKTLAREEFVHFDPQAKTYVLGHGALALARGALDPADVFDRFRDGLARIAHDFDAAVGLWRLTPAERLVMLGCEQGRGETRIELAVGQRLPMLGGAGGRCVAAHHGLSSEQIRREFARLRWQDAPTYEAFLDQVAAAQRKGWSLDVDQFLRGATSAAAPVTGPGGKVAYMVTATVFSRQHDDARLEALGERLVACAADIKRRLIL